MSNKKVANDMGHGINTFPPSKGIYKDGKAYAEHTFNAKVGIKIRYHLERHGVTSVEAQPPNKTDVALRTRTDYYNAQKVDLVWSTHANYNGNKEVKGMGIFYWKGTQKGKEIAEYYIKLCKEAGLPIWGTGVFTSTNVPSNHWTNFAITRDTNAVALLAENGFFSNDEDFNRIFNTPSYIDLIGEISAKSILYGLNVAWKDEVVAEAKTAVVKPVSTPTPIIIPTEKEEIKLSEKLYKPSNNVIINDTITVLRRLENHEEGGLDPQWRHKLLNGELTESDAIGLIYVALKRGLIQGEKKCEKCEE